MLCHLAAIGTFVLCLSAVEQAVAAPLSEKFSLREVVARLATEMYPTADRTFFDHQLYEDLIPGRETNPYGMTPVYEYDFGEGAGRGATYAESRDGDDVTVSFSYRDFSDLSQRDCLTFGEAGRILKQQGWQTRGSDNMLMADIRTRYVRNGVSFSVTNAEPSWPVLEPFNSAGTHHRQLDEYAARAEKRTRIQPGSDQFQALCTHSISLT